MFAKAKGRAEGTEASVPSVISSSMHVTGDLKAEGDVHVDGTVEGDIVGRSITVGATATVRGEVVAERVDVFGQITGRIRARDIVLQPSARISGDLVHETLEIARGAMIEGTIKRHEPKDAPEARQPKLVISDGEIMAGTTRQA